MLKETGLVIKAQHGDGEAFVQVTRQYEKRLYGVVRRYLKDEDTADVLQETILIAFKNIHSLEQPKCFNAWITKILINECTGLLKQNKQYPYQMLDETIELASQISVETLALEDLIAELNASYRIPILLHYASGFSCKEISQIIDEPLDTVQSQISRGKALLQKEYLKESSVMNQEFEIKLQKLKYEDAEIPEKVRGTLDKTYQKIEMDKVKKFRRKKAIGLAAVVLLILLGFSPIAKAVDNYVKFGQFTSKTLKDNGFAAKSVASSTSNGIRIALEEGYLDQRQLGLHFMINIPDDSALISDQIDYYNLGFSIKDSEGTVLFSNTSIDDRFKGSTTGTQHFDSKNHTLDITVLLNGFQEEVATSGNLTIEIEKITGANQGQAEAGGGFEKAELITIDGNWNLPLKKKSLEEFKAVKYSGVLSSNQKVTGEAYPTIFKIETNPFEGAKDTLDISLVSKHQGAAEVYPLLNSSMQNGLLVWCFDYPGYGQEDELTLRINGQDLAVLTIE